MNWNLIKFFAVIVLFVGLSACGDSGWVTDAELKTFEQTNDIHAELTTYLNSSGLQLPALDIPITEARNPNIVLGQISLRPSLSYGADAELTISINMTQITKIKGDTTDSLPNGRPIPISGYDANQLISILIPKSNIRVYVSLDTKNEQALFGVAIPIKQFENIGARTGDANLFPIFNLQNGLKGSFGIFTGDGAGKNGFALFMDVSQLIGQKIFFLRDEGTGSFGLTAFEPKTLLKPLLLNFLDGNSSRSQERRIQKGLYRLIKKKTPLSLY